MNSAIYIPQTIKVGYVERKDTYTGKLAYVIYYDQKNKLRKETSWESWRDKKIEPNDFENIPTNGFVLNKKVGDYVSDWNHRQAYVRIYDPRNFEFEITLENLMYILENTNSIKGKGLEGDFVYGWSGKDILLLPTESPDYIGLTTYSDMLVNPEKITGKDIIFGATYRTHKNQDWIYLCRSDYYDYYDKPIKKYIFKFKDGYDAVASLSGKIIKCVSSEPVSNYAKLMSDLECQTFYSPIDTSKNEYIPYTTEEFAKIVAQNNSYTYLYVMYDNVPYNIITYNFKTFDRHYHYENRYQYDLLLRRMNDDMRINQLTIEQMHDKYTFCKIKQYLMNGKVYKGRDNG